MKLKNFIFFTTCIYCIALSVFGMSVRADSVNPDRLKLHNPIHKCSSEYEKDTSSWSTIYFGSYPQSVVTDPAIKAAIDAKLVEQESFVGKAKYVVGDCVVDGVKYRKVRIGDVYKSSNFEKLYITDKDNLANNYAYFRYAPIKWRVLSIDTANNKMLILSNQAIDAYGYDTGNTCRPWWDSSIREFLNNYREVSKPDATTVFKQFKKTAFHESEQNIIIPSPGITGFNPDRHDQTESRNKAVTDGIFLLSWEQIYDKSYGFCPNEKASSSRIFCCTDYAIAQGCDASIRSNSPKECPWWLCTDDGSIKASAYNISERGRLEVSLDYAANGVVPAMWISLDSMLYTYAGEVNAGLEDSVYTGKIFTIGNMKYKILDMEKDFSVQYLGSTNKQVKTIKIPATVKHKGYTFKVTSIAYRAHKGSRKLKSVEMSTYIQSIGYEAFANCPKLKKVVIRSKKLSSVGSNAFEKMAKKSTITIPKKYKNKYKRLLNKKYTKSSTKIQYK